MEANEPPRLSAPALAVLRAEGFELGLFDADTDIQVQPLAHNPLNAVTAGINVVSWPGGSAVRKHLTSHGDGADHWTASEDERHFNYWLREVLVYRTELPERLGLDAPALLGEIEAVDGSFILWLERVEGTSGIDVTIADLGTAARQLGAGQGRSAQPTDSWLSTNYIGDYAASKPAPYELLSDDSTWRHPLVSRNWSRSLRSELLRVHQNRGWYHDLLARLPRAVCHLDVWPNNLVVRPNGTVAFLDWSFTGHGALGEDIGNLIPDAVLDLLVPASDIGELEDVVLTEYLRGLEEVGWNGDPRLVQLGMYASCVKYHWAAPIFLSHLDAETHLAYGQPCDPDRLYAERGVALELLATWSQEAETLAGSLGL